MWMSLILVLIASFSASALASDSFNGPFGPQMQCFNAIKDFSVFDPLLPSKKTQGMTPILMTVDQPPLLLGLAQPSGHPDQHSIAHYLESKGSMILHFFTASGEFDAVIPYPADGERTCVDGVSFPDGRRAVIYESTGPVAPVQSYARPDSRTGDMMALDPGSTCESLGHKEKRIAVAHQVGMAGQQASQALLDGALAKFIGSVHANWKDDTDAARRRKENPIDRKPIPSDAYNPKTGWLNASAYKSALESCSSALSTPEFQSVRAIVGQEEQKFDKAQAPGGNSGSSPSDRAHAASVF